MKKWIERLLCWHDWYYADYVIDDKCNYAEAQSYLCKKCGKVKPID